MQKVSGPQVVTSTSPHASRARLPQGAAPRTSRRDRNVAKGAARPAVGRRIEAIVGAGSEIAVVALPEARSCMANGGCCRARGRCSFSSNAPALGSLVNLPPQPCRSSRRTSHDCLHALRARSHPFRGLPSTLDRTPKVDSSSDGVAPDLRNRPVSVAGNGCPHNRSTPCSGKPRIPPAENRR
jgi:hypothetical protein